MRNLEKDEREMKARRERMLETGFRLFSEKSIESVSMNEIAAACGVGIAALYRYYGTKLGDVRGKIVFLNQLEVPDDLTDLEEYQFRALGPDISPWVNSSTSQEPSQGLQRINGTCAWAQDVYDIEDGNRKDFSGVHAAGKMMESSSVFCGKRNSTRLF